MTAIVAGTAPSERMIASTSRAISIAGKGMPWVTMVDSSATTGVPLWPWRPPLRREGKREERELASVMCWIVGFSARS